MREAACGVGVGSRWNWRGKPALLLSTAWLAAGGACAQQDGAMAGLSALPQPLAAMPALAPPTASRLALTLTPPLPTAAAPASALDMGLQWRQQLSGRTSVDITAWRRTSPQPDALSLVQQRDPTVYGARAEMKFGGHGSLIKDLRSALGVQLDSGARIGLRRVNGGPTVYYRTQF